ncbi:MAG: endolytic transglycosylase MltG [Alphaproteobacteria bacterium]|nr:endolytic transglycosylase MltG [Alphaproteobacteria bacterium]
MKLVALAGAFVFGLTTVAIALPYLFLWQQPQQVQTAPTPFPVSVNPLTKTITESPQIDAILAAHDSRLTAAANDAGGVLGMLVSAFTSTSVYRLLAAVDAPQIVTIEPGYREEQVALVFGKALGWDARQQAAFLASMATTSPTLVEGEFSPGTYAIPPGATPADVQKALYQRFYDQVLEHYSTTTSAIVPLSQTLTIASMIERETGDPGDMRIISGIMWNRLFLNMKLQIDSTVQYAEADRAKSGSWWPAVRTKNLFIDSPYNTYVHTGLPPTPIAEPSVAAVLAALNPVKTSCLYYFHDAYGQLHCSDTYQQHVALLKKYYGRGK